MAEDDSFGVLSPITRRRLAVYVKKPSIDKFRSFREFNTAFERWMEETFAPSMRAAVDDPNENKPVTLSDVYRSETEQMAVVVNEHLERLQTFWFWSDVEEGCFNAWRERILEEREAAVLHVLEVLQQQDDRFHNSAGRHLAPEITLERMAGDPEALKELCRELVVGPDLNDPMYSCMVKGELAVMLLIDNEAFERQYRTGRYDPATPLPRTIRALVQRS